MSTDNFAEPVSDPEAEGLPAYADDDSFADPERPSSRIADGPSPAALPSDRPLGVTEFGTTANEQLEGEPLEDRLRREVPDVTEQLDAPAPTDPVDAAQAEWESTRTDEMTELDGSPREDWTERTPAPSEDAATEMDLDPPPADTESLPGGNDPHLDSEVSSYERLSDDEVGRLVEPDQGYLTDDEPDAVASDRGVSGGGASAEELAMHPVRDES